MFHVVDFMTIGECCVIIAGNQIIKPWLMSQTGFGPRPLDGRRCAASFHECKVSSARLLPMLAIYRFLPFHDAASGFTPR